MASVMPDLRLPSQPQGIAASGPVPNYILFLTDAHVCEQLARGCYLRAERPGVEPPATVIELQVKRHNCHTTRPHWLTCA